MGECEHVYKPAVSGLKVEEGMKKGRGTVYIFQITECEVSFSSSETEFTLHSIMRRSR